LKNAYAGSLSLAPTAGMISELKKDYELMSGMIFGEIPAFEEIIDTIAKFESQINQA
jgi:hypothetical protein